MYIYIHIVCIYIYTYMPYYSHIIYQCIIPWTAPRAWINEHPKTVWPAGAATMAGAGGTLFGYNRAGLSLGGWGYKIRGSCMGWANRLDLMQTLPCMRRKLSVRQEDAPGWRDEWGCVGSSVTVMFAHCIPSILTSSSWSEIRCSSGTGNGVPATWQSLG